MGECLKHDRFVAVDKNPVFDVRTNRPGEYNLFEVAAFADQIFHRVSMGHSHYVLLDDWPVVENLSDVVTGRADQLHSAFERLMIGAGADECREKGMMDIDDTLRIPPHEIIG